MLTQYLEQTSTFTMSLIFFTVIIIAQVSMQVEGVRKDVLLKA